MSNRIAISVWDWDRVADELVAHASPFNFNQIKDHPTYANPKGVSCA